MNKIDYIKIGTKELNSVMRSTAKKIDNTNKQEHRLYGITQPGMICAFHLTAFLEKARVVNDPHIATALIDIGCHTGHTRKLWKNKFPKKDFFVLYDKTKNKSNRWYLVSWY